MNKIKKAEGLAPTGELAETVVTDLAPKVLDKVMSGIQGGEQIDAHAAIDEVSGEEGIKVDETTRQDLVQKIDEEQRNMMKTMEQEATTFASESKRELMFKLGQVYSKSSLDLTEAVKIWKQAKLNPNNIREQIQNDVGVRVSLAEAKILHTLGSDLMLGMSDLDFGKAYANDILQKLMTKQTVKLTPSVREAVERVGKNVYRTKRASSVMWKIDVKHTDDGQQVPYLLRLENVEAEDGNTTKGTE